jgi:hypothetical protein
MSAEGQRPLQRLTTLRDDPAAAWLSTSGRLRVWLTAALGWGTFTLAVIAFKMIFFRALPFLFLVPGRFKYAAIGVLAVAIRPAVRRTILRQQSVRRAAVLRQSAPAEAVTIDDWSELDGAPEDQLVSVVGWAHARLRLPHPVAGEPCIGLALPCQQSYPGLFETSHDFDLVDETGRLLPIQVANARMLGEATVDLGGGDAQHLLVGSLDLPAGAMPSWHACLLRDGDPLLIVGFKKSIVDPSEHGLRQSPVRAAVGSSGSRPLLIFPINLPIDAERRAGSGWG